MIAPLRSLRPWLNTRHQRLSLEHCSLPRLISGFSLPASCPTRQIPTHFHLRDQKDRRKSVCVKWAIQPSALAPSLLQYAPMSNQTTIPPTAARYSPPSTGIIAYLPKSWIPYAELIRLDKPTGTYYLFFPCLFSTLLAAPLAVPMSDPSEVFVKSALFFTGAVIMRGAGCTINDLWDRNLDPHVERTKLRPVARGAVSPQKAVIFTGFQLLAGLGILVQFPLQCLWYGIPSLVLVTAYPLAKRVTDYPQVVLGLTFSWGAFMGFPALGIDLLSQTHALATAAALYTSCIAWTVLYDMIYAHMDIKDDVRAGIRSIALRHEHNTKVVLSGLAMAQVTLLAIAGVASGAGPVFFFGSCGSAILSLGIMIWRVRLKDVKNCWWWFKHGCWITGGGIALGMVGDYFARLSGLYQREHETSTDKGHSSIPSAA